MYETTLRLTEDQLADRRLLLDLGDVGDLAEVTIDGEELPRLLWSPYVVDATEALRAGDNAVEVRVTNTLQNRRTNKPLPSGLLGPVTLRPEAVVDVRLR